MPALRACGGDTGGLLLSLMALSFWNMIGLPALSADNNNTVVGFFWFVWGKGRLDWLAQDRNERRLPHGIDEKSGGVQSSRCSCNDVTLWSYRFIWHTIYGHATYESGKTHFITREDKTNRIVLICFSRKTCLTRVLFQYRNLATSQRHGRYVAYLASRTKKDS